MDSECKTMMLILLALFPLASGVSVCPGGSLPSPDEKSCFTPIESRGNFDSLEATCEKFKGRLAWINNAFENERARNVLTTDNSSKTIYLAIGLRLVSGQWRWNTTGNLATYTNWGKGHPVDGMDCAVIDRHSSLGTQGQWFSIKCETEYAGLCRHPTQPTTLCEDGWTHFSATKSCYRVFVGDLKSDASKVCSDNRASVVSIHSDDENQFIADLTTTNVAQNKDNGISYMTWLGLTYDSESTSYKWSDGSTGNYTSWSHNGGQPSRKGGDCVAMASDVLFGSSVVYSLGDWFTYPCNHSQRAVVCKRTEN